MVLSYILSDNRLFQKNPHPRRNAWFLDPPSTWISKTAWAPPPVRISKFKDPLPTHPDFNKINLLLDTVILIILNVEEFV